MSLIFLIIGLIFPLITIIIKRVSAFQFSTQIESILALCHGYALKFNIHAIAPELMLYAIAKDEIGVAFQILLKSEFKKQLFIEDIEKRIKNPDKINENRETVPLFLETEKCLTESVLIAKKMKTHTNSGHLLQAIVASKSIVAMQTQYQIPSNDFVTLRLQESEFASLSKLEKFDSTFERIKKDFF